LSNLATNEERIAFLNEKAKELQVKQQEELVGDYDAALEEYRKKKKPHVIKFLGRKYTVPASAPFNFMTFWLRHCMKKRDGRLIVEIPDDRLLEFLQLMFGVEFVQDIEAEGIEFEFIWNHIALDVLALWGIWRQSGGGNAEKK